jgi:hypothetical protein
VSLFLVLFLRMEKRQFCSPTPETQISSSSRPFVDRDKISRMYQTDETKSRKTPTDPQGPTTTVSPILSRETRARLKL